MSTVYHESDLSPGAREIHRALASLTEELEAIDWYNQRMDVTEDAELRDILEHNRNEEIEHASMVLEWIRRKIPRFDEELRTYLFTSGSITEAEESGGGGDRQPEAERTEGDLGLLK
jgi:ferritin-like protein